MFNNSAFGLADFNASNRQISYKARYANSSPYNLSVLFLFFCYGGLD